MDTNITFNFKRIIVNGREYRSVEELPPDLRAAYEKAMASREGAGPVPRITVNTQQYDSPEAMPPDVRRLYEAVRANLPKEGAVPVAVPPGADARAIEPPATSGRAMAVLIAGACLLVLLYWLYGR